MEPVYQQYLDHLEELSALLEKMTGTANRKAAAARVGDLVKVDACMKEEQAYSMSLRSMDQRRDKMLKAMELALRDIERMFPAEGAPPAADPAVEPPPRMKTDFRA